MKRWTSLGLVLLFAACFTIMGACGGGSDEGGSGAKFDRFQITGGDEWNCALDGGAGVYCFGDNEYGNMGVGLDSSADSEQFVPAKVINLGNAIKVVSGDYFACALMKDGSVKCWGEGSNGQLGNATFSEEDSPVNVHGLEGLKVVDIACSPEGYHVCALLNVGGMKCWGWDDYGQLGDENTGNQDVPVNVHNISGLKIVQMAATYYSTCILLNTGAVKCWGYGGDGELGDGNCGSS